MRPVLSLQPGDGIAAVIRELRRLIPALAPLVLGKPLKGLALTTSEQAFKHNLGGKPEGFIVTDLSGDFRVWRTKASDTENIYLRASAAATVDVWVY